MFERYTFTQCRVTNQDLKQTLGLKLVKGFQVIGDKDAREFQTTKFITKVGVIFPFPLFHT